MKIDIRSAKAGTTSTLDYQKTLQKLRKIDLFDIQGSELLTPWTTGCLHQATMTHEKAL